MIRFICGLFAAAFVAVSTGTASAQVVNGDFEAGGASWTASSWGIGNPGFAANSGVNAGITGCVGPACTTLPGAQLYQDVPTVAGASYTLTFWYRTSTGADAPVELQTLWSNGAPTSGGAGTCTGSCVYQTATPQGAWTQVTQVVVATGPTMRITFLGRNDPAGIYVDDVNLALLAPPATIPTLSEWAMILFGLMLAGFAALTVMRRRSLSV